MKFSKLAQLVAVSSVGLTLFACSNAPKMMTQAMPQSGFLPNYTLLQAVPNTPSGTRVWRYRNEAVNPTAYTAVIIDPIYLNQTPTQNITAESLIQAKIALQDSMVQAVMGKGDIKIVSKPGRDLVFFTTGRLTSEMVIKGVQMEIPFLLTRSGVTLMGLELARKTNLTLLSRCSGKHFEIYNAPERVIFSKAS